MARHVDKDYLHGFEPRRRAWALGTATRHPVITLRSVFEHPRVYAGHGSEAMIKSISMKIELMAREHGFTDFKWMNPRDVVIGHWVRMKCQFGCDGYGKGGCCPPEVPSVADCRKFLDEYKVGLLLHCAVRFVDPEPRRRWSRATQKKAVALERQVFLADYPKAFVFPPGGPCRICVSCSTSRRECKNPYAARPSLEAFAVDVYATARRMRYPIHVLKGYGEEMNRFGLLLVE